MQHTRSNLHLRESQLRVMGVFLIHKADEPMNNSDSYIPTMTSEIMESPEQA